MTNSEVRKSNDAAQPKILRGSVVEVKSAKEILATLDDQGTTGNLPFMPEMLEMVGQQFRVFRRVEHFSFDGDETCGDESSVRAFAENDVVVLENCRCSGLAHGGCKRGCSIFWREAWLKPVECGSAMKNSPQIDLAKNENGSEEFQDQLQSRQMLEDRLADPGNEDSAKYFCQSSQLLIATHPVSFAERVRRCIRNVFTGNYGPIEMLRNIVVWVYVRGREKLFGPFPVGTLKQTPAETLNFQVGELVQVKSLDEIKQTLDRRGFNRGLHFAPEMIPYCGKTLRVLARADRMIAEGIGTMRSMKNTVILEDSVCDSATWAFGACPRQDYIYWREIWLKRVQPHSDSDVSTVSVEPVEAVAAE